MNIFTLEEWAAVKTVCMVVFGVLTVIWWVLSIYFYINKPSCDYNDDIYPEGQVPVWLCFLTSSILLFMISYGCYYNTYCERPLVCDGIELAKEREWIERRCTGDNAAIGCENRWAQYRADSTWLVHQLANARKN